MSVSVYSHDPDIISKPMPPLIKFLIQRLIFAVISFFVITALLYAGIMLTPPETRAELYMPKNLSSRMTEEQIQRLIHH